MSSSGWWAFCQLDALLVAGLSGAAPTPPKFEALRLKILESPSISANPERPWFVVLVVVKDIDLKLYHRIKDQRVEIYSFHFDYSNTQGSRDREAVHRDWWLPAGRE